MSDLKWYVLKSISGQENKVKNYIENEMKHHGFEQYVTQVVIPMEKVIVMRNGKKVPKERPYYPGYLMVEANLIGEIPHIIKNIPGVISFLSLTKGGDPVPMRKSEVNRMLGRMDELSEFATELEIPYVVGENIKIIEGPFNGFNGTVEKILEDKKKLEVSVLIFGRKTPMELSFLQVEKV
ncbi:transcription termination/antitermination factor NusG [Marnyiella aurantia]|uniref:Transcription termination/antitermination protein NusG n=1 Tax=Marnyiella aurantia TaxID=2758037 RepID=A0A7D7LNN2_9FLAO|nr:MULTISPECIES: transcription termination/antitermination protein NusG [Weeksellaceae]MBA5247878.1 transcription termination/antitermination factor NusG [Marnyiella aurantia]MBP0613575.1 transcription termination/antitermination factor NusG [Marnyiella aurantia]MDF0718535.1 transcription termination/antitermination protein NusG [Kaistella sp. PBT33-4]QFG53979.1 transcription termination/antitermination factor NusG [Chryseobacterium sp.]QMS99499.1 transcription termination/antitermination fact